MTKKISDPSSADLAPLAADAAYYVIKGLLKKRISIRRKMDALDSEFDNICRIIARLAPLDRMIYLIILMISVFTVLSTLKVWRILMTNYVFAVHDSRFGRLSPPLLRTLSRCCNPIVCR